MIGPFLSMLWRALRAEGILDGKVNQPLILAQFNSLIKANPIELTSKAAKQHLHRACLMLAAYRVLKTKIDHDQLLNALETALCAPNSWIIRSSTRALLFFSADPMTTLVNYTKNRIPPIYGDVFAFSNEGSADKQFTMRISSCFYNDFFRRNNAQALTPLFCAWDRNWIEPISAEKHGVIFRRETTLANGDDSCPFTFIRINQAD